VVVPLLKLLQPACPATAAVDVCEIRPWLLQQSSSYVGHRRTLCYCHFWCGMNSNPVAAGPYQLCKATTAAVAAFSTQQLSHQLASLA
jgi:hypothetical protein